MRLYPLLFIFQCMEKAPCTQLKQFLQNVFSTCVDISLAIVTFGGCTSQAPEGNYTSQQFFKQLFILMKTEQWPDHT